MLRINRSPWKLTIFIVIISFALISQHVFKGQDVFPATPESLFLTTYADGEVDVEFTVYVDSSLASVNVSPPGKFYEDLIITNENELLLDYTILNGNISVDSLGSSKLELSYSTADLTNKIGRVWVLHVNSTIDFAVLLPDNSTIIDLSSVPISIGSAGGVYFLTMPSGEQEISYVIGIIGSKESAILAINQAEQAIAKAKAANVTVSNAETKLRDAKAASEKERYAEAELLATEAKQIAEEAYSNAAAYQFPYMLLALGLAVCAAASILYVYYRRQKTSKKQETTLQPIDVNKILEERKYMRMEDQEAIKRIASAGGEIFESSLREQLELPKSTLWRLVRRLQREGLIEVEKVGGQNLIRLIYSGDSLDSSGTR